MRNRPFLGLWWYQWLGVVTLGALWVVFVIPEHLKCLNWHEKPVVVWDNQRGVLYPRTVYERVCDVFDEGSSDE